MVQRFTWRQIAKYLAVILAIVACIILFRDIYQKDISYIANDESLNLAVIDGIVQAKDVVIKDEIKAVVVPHHLVASKSIALGIKSIAKSNPKLVVVISPDHFKYCSKMFCTSKGQFETYFGNSLISNEVVEKILNSKDIMGSSKLFSLEHGIFTIIPFIKYYIPDAEVVPIVVSQKGRGSSYQREEILRILKPIIVQDNVALVISSDFSHYLPLDESNVMDELTSKSFCTGNSDEILNLKNPSQSDCPLCLWILEQTAKQLDFWNPSIGIHTNSANLMRDVSAKETTSHFMITLSEIDSDDKCILND